MTRGDRIVVEYEAKFLRLSRYSLRLLEIDYDKSIRFEEGLRYDIKFLVAP